MPKPERAFFIVTSGPRARFQMVITTRSGLHTREESPEMREKAFEHPPLGTRRTPGRKTKKGDEEERSVSPSKPSKAKIPAKAKDSSQSSWGTVFLFVIVAAIVGVLALSQVQNGNPTRPNDSNVDPATMIKNREKRKSDLGALMDSNFKASELVVAKKIVVEVLLRNERQLEAGTVQRATVFHFGGGSEGDAYKRMEQVIEHFMFGAANSLATLRIAVHKGELDGIRGKIFDQLTQHPRSLIIFEKSDEVAERSLQVVEDAFESMVFEHSGQRVDCTKAVFVLQTSIGEGMAAAVCGEGDSCAVSDKDALVRHLKQASQLKWTRQAFVARIREVVPFA